jgi:hypothetical protein
MKKANIASWGAAVVVASSLAIVMPVFAQTGANVGVGVGANVGVNLPGGIHNGANGGARLGGMPNGGGIFGTVSAVNGDTLTVTSHAYARPPHPMPEQPATNMPMIQATTTYTVDATNAKIYKGSATTTVSVSDIAVNDTVVVQGTVSGTSITATVIRDGVVPMTGRPGMPGKFFGHGASSTPSGTPIIQGNGEPVVGGKVTTISGTTITVTNTGNVTYTIDAASTTIVKNGTSTAIGNIAVGDSLIVQGAVNGNSVAASSIIDQGVKVSPGNASSSASHGFGGGFGAGIGGLFSAIGGFFQHLFGF